MSTITTKGQKAKAVDARDFDIRDMIGYALGGVGNNFTFNLVNSFLMIFYTNVFGLAAALVGAFGNYALSGFDGRPSHGVMGWMAFILGVAGGVGFLVGRGRSPGGLAGDRRRVRWGAAKVTVGFGVGPGFGCIFL